MSQSNVLTVTLFIMGITVTGCGMESETHVSASDHSQSAGASSSEDGDASNGLGLRGLATGDVMYTMKLVERVYVPGAPAYRDKSGKLIPAKRSRFENRIIWPKNITADLWTKSAQGAALYRYTASVSGSFHGVYRFSDAGTPQLQTPVNITFHKTITDPSRGTVTKTMRLQATPGTRKPPVLRTGSYRVQTLEQLGTKESTPVDRIVEIDLGTFIIPL